MPTYVFRCEKCGDEAQASMTLKLFERHRGGLPCLVGTCDGRAVPVIQPTTFALKGSGWAKDGYSGRKK